jgi:hypothetical protein
MPALWVRAHAKPNPMINHLTSTLCNHNRQRTANSRPCLENRGRFTFYGRCDRDHAAWRYYRTELGLHYEPIPPATSYVVTLVIMSGGIPDCATACLFL